MTAEHEYTGSLPRFMDIEPATLGHAQIVVLHHPRSYGAEVLWTFSLTDRVGRPIARETVPVPTGDYFPQLAAEAHLHLVGLDVYGVWQRSRHGDDVRHYALVGPASAS